MRSLLFVLLITVPLSFCKSFNEIMVQCVTIVSFWITWSERNMAAFYGNLFESVHRLPMPVLSRGSPICAQYLSSYFSNLLTCYWKHPMGQTYIKQVQNVFNIYPIFYDHICDWKSPMLGFHQIKLLKHSGIWPPPTTPDFKLQVTQKDDFCSVVSSSPDSKCIFCSVHKEPS